MKFKTFILTFLMMMSSPFLFGQQHWTAPGYRNNTGEDLPLLPMRGEIVNKSAPLGSGLLILAGLGAAYAMRKRKND